MEKLFSSCNGRHIGLFKQKKQCPYWMLLILSSFLHDVKAAILVYSNKETVAILDVIYIQ